MGPTTRRWLKRLGYLLGALVFLALLLWFVVIPRWAQPTARESVSLGEAERAAANAKLEKLGLKLPDGGVYLEHPFEAPWSSRSLLVPDSWRLPGARAFLGKRVRVRADLLLEDVDLLQAVMSRAYGGWDTAARRGWNWDKWFEDWRAQLRAVGRNQLALDDAFAPIDALEQFQLDNHTQIPLERMSTASVSQTALLASTPSAPCTELRSDHGTVPLDVHDPAQQPHATLLASVDGTFRPASYLSAPSRRGELEAVHCGNAWIPLEVVSEPGHSLLGYMVENLVGSKDRPTVRMLTPEIAYARVPEMNPAVYAGVDRDRPSWPKPTGNERALIIDLRGNGGGEAGYGQSVIQDWIELKRLPEFEQFGMDLGSSCLYAPLKWGFLRMFLGMAPSDADSRDSLQAMLDRMAKPSPPGCPRQEQVTPPKVAYRDHRLQSAKGMRIIALVDNGCGSDCEFLVGQLAALPETIVIGVNTLGVAQFIQPGYGVLPHSGLPYRIALGNSDVYGDGRSFDGYGFDVDVLLPHPAKWNDSALVKVTQALLARQ